MDNIPIPRLTPGNWFFEQIIPRVARLCCVSNEFSDLWSRVYNSEWKYLHISDNGTSIIESWKDLSPKWNEDIAVLNLNNNMYPIGDRAQLQCEIDGLIAHLYSISENEFEHILSTFPLIEERAPWLIKGAIREWKRFVSMVPTNS